MNTSIVIALVLIALNLYILHTCNKPEASGKMEPAAIAGPKWKVYGTMNCGWTRKQLDFMNEKGIAHEFIDCEKEECEFNAFPTLFTPSGEKRVGYTEDM